MSNQDEQKTSLDSTSKNTKSNTKMIENIITMSEKQRWSWCYSLRKMFKKYP